MGAADPLAQPIHGSGRPTSASEPRAWPHDNWSAAWQAWLLLAVAGLLAFVAVRLSLRRAS